jgi:hypothetical protein
MVSINIIKTTNKIIPIYSLPNLEVLLMMLAWVR